MKCSCGGNVKTIDSRHQTDGTIKRRKECEVCAVRFTTFEAKCDDATALLARRKRVLVIDDDRYNSLLKASLVIGEIEKALRSSHPTGGGHG